MKFDPFVYRRPKLPWVRRSTFEAAVFTGNRNAADAREMKRQFSLQLAEVNRKLCVAMSRLDDIKRILEQ